MLSSLLSTTATLALLTITTQATPLPSVPSAPGEMCEAGRVYYPRGQCETGFVGCAPPNANEICHSKAQWTFNNDCGPQAYNLGQWFACGTNGFNGCNTITNICDLKLSGKNDKNTPTPPVNEDTPKPPSKNPWSCPAGTTYLGAGVCSSGFVGCHQSSGDICSGSKHFYPGDCPAGLTFQRCANGFIGCSTDTKMCG